MEDEIDAQKASRRAFVTLVIAVVSGGCLDSLTDGGRGTEFSVIPFETISEAFDEGVLEEVEVLDCDDERIQEHPVFPELIQAALEDSAEDSGGYHTTIGETMDEPMGDIPLTDELAFGFVECEGQVFALTYGHPE